MKRPREPLSLYQYAEEELEYLDVQGGGRLLREEDLLVRWALSDEPEKGKRVIKKCRLGLSGRKYKLPAVCIGPRTYRYRLRDVLAYEYLNRA